MTQILKSAFAIALAAALAILGVRGVEALTAPAQGLGAAPGFSLTAQDGRAFDLNETKGAVVALSFVFTRCADICPVATYKLVWIQDELGVAFGPAVAFVTVTIDPAHDTVEALADYADQLGANPAGWTFLTGGLDQVRRVAESYGVYMRPGEEAVEHILLTTLIDRDGVIRMQYLGERFDPREMLADIRALMDEA